MDSADIRFGQLDSGEGADAETLTKDITKKKI